MTKKAGFLPLFFPKQIRALQLSMSPKPRFYDVDGQELQACSQPVLHCIKGSMCVWCERSREELLNQGVDAKIGHDVAAPRPDFLSPTTATVNTPVPLAGEQEGAPMPAEAVNVARMDLAQVQAYCLKCRVNVAVIDPKYVQKDTRRGVQSRLLGTCARCGAKINAIAGAKT